MSALDLEVKKRDIKPQQDMRMYQKINHTTTQEERGRAGNYAVCNKRAS